jgi:hypothetical protein
MWPITLIPTPMTSLKSMSMALEVLDSMLTNGVVSLKKHMRNGTSSITQARLSSLNISLGPPQAVLCKALLGATLEGPLEVVSPPGIVQLILQSTYMKSVLQNTLLTTIRCPLVKRLMTVGLALLLTAVQMEELQVMMFG